MEKVTILYSRVSTEEQGKNGFSLDFQKHQLLDYIQKNEISNYIFFEEFGESATNLNRPKMRLMLEMIKSGEVKEIVFYKIDRISRNVLDFAELNKLCELASVRLTSLTERLEKSAMGEFSQNIMIAMAELESKRISERSKAGYVGGFKKGIFPLGGPMPLGISRTPERRLEYNDDIKYVIEIYELNQSGASHVEIIKIMKRKYNLTLQKNGLPRILNNTLYKGYYDYQGERYWFLEPLEINGGEIPDFSQPKRNLNKYGYKLRPYLPDYKLTTKQKFNHASGKTKYYTYYKKPNSKVIISEEKFFRQLNKHIDLNNTQTRTVQHDQMRKLNELYVMTNMDDVEYEHLKSTINEKVKEIWALKNCISIDISESYVITVKYKKSELKFPYKK